MKDLKTVILFTMKDMLKRKSFIVSTIIILVLIVIGFNIPNLIKSTQGENLGERILIIDKDNVFENSLELLKQSEIGYSVDIKNEEIKYEQIKEKIENKDCDSIILIDKKNEGIDIKYIVKSTTMMEAVPEDLINTLTSIYSNLQISKLNLSDEELNSITPNFNFILEQTDEEEASGNILVMMLLSIVLFYAIHFCASQVSSSITTEKTSKIIETLVTSTTPKTIVLGKTIGIGIVGILQMIIIVGTALISAKTFIEPEILESVLDMSNISIYLGIITLVYFLLGYLTYALLYAMTGSTVSKPEDIQSANTPIVFLTMGGFYLSYFTMLNPTSDLNSLAAILPISSPFCMPFRIMMGLASTKDVIISISILFVMILIIAKIAIKIYSNAILNYGSKMGIKDIIKLYKEKN